MYFKHILKTAFIGLRTNKSRSALTILGIVIGITAIIIVMSVGQGAQELILNQIRGLGSQTIIIEPGREPQGPSDAAEIFTDSLKEKDIEALKKPANVMGVQEIAANVMRSEPIVSETDKIRENVLGTSDTISDLLDIHPSEGSFFTEEDLRQKADVAVLGSEAKKKLFGDSSAVGKKIKIKNHNFRIIGTVSEKGQVGILNIDNLVIVPYTTAQQYLFGINYFNSIIVKAQSEDLVLRITEDIKLTLRESHGIDDPSKDDFHVMSQADIVDRVSMITNILKALLVSVATISLVVGGIGIMNIMLVSVTERTREIGLRKALGATEKNILTQFLVEAVILTGVGGIFGILFGAGISFLASIILSKVVSSGWTFIFPISAAILGLAVSSFVGLLFGLYPARKASLKSPIEALRYE